MSGPDSSALPVHRRGFLQTGALATASALALGSSGSLRADDPPAPATLPKRPLGQTGSEVTILNLGTFRNPGLDRLLRLAYALGVRYFDTARSYGSEPAFKRWFQAMPEVRKEIFLATKDSPNSPRQLLNQLDQRLDALGTDYIDLLFIHALGDRSIDQGIAWPKSQEFKETVEAIKKTGKARFVGFSTHHARRAEILQSAAEGGFVDAIMLQYTAWIEPDAPLNRAIDACHQKGIGIVSMKQVAGQSDRILDEVPRRVPTFEEKKLSPYGGLLHAIWTDERIASACVSMRNTDQIRENVHGARTFEPLTTAELRQLRDACRAAGPTFCADCDGRCARAANTGAALDDLTRLLTYHEQYGIRGEARRLYSEMSPQARDWHGADLNAARQACPNHLDFASLLPRAERLLG